MSDSTSNSTSQKASTLLGRIFGVIAITLGAGAVTCGGNLLGYNASESLFSVVNDGGLVYGSMILIWFVQIVIAFIVSILWFFSSTISMRFKNLTGSTKVRFMIGFTVLPSIIAITYTFLSSTFLLASVFSYFLVGIVSFLPALIFFGYVLYRIFYKDKSIK